jgi:sulfopropanediol 3-dehydrogenase
VVADGSVDGEIRATDLLGQAAPGPNSPIRKSSRATRWRRCSVCSASRTPSVAAKAWRDYGEVIVCDSEEEAVREADRIAPEHVQVMTRGPDNFLNKMTNYGALFLRPAHERRVR